MPAVAVGMRSVERVCDVLDVVRAQSTGVSLDRAAELCGLPRSSVYRYLVALERRGYVERQERRGAFSYRAGRRRLAASRWPARPVAAELAEVLRPLRLRWRARVVVAVLDVGRAELRAICDLPAPGASVAPPVVLDDIVAVTAIAALPEAAARRVVRGLDRALPGAPFAGRLASVRGAGLAVVTDPVGSVRVSVPVPGVGTPVALVVAVPLVRYRPELLTTLPAAAARCAAALDAVAPGPAVSDRVSMSKTAVAKMTRDDLR